jgi:hypothetical protein
LPISITVIVDLNNYAPVSPFAAIYEDTLMCTGQGCQQVAKVADWATFESARD